MPTTSQQYACKIVRSTKPKRLRSHTFTVIVRDGQQFIVKGNVQAQMERLLDRASHSVYCGEPSERKRLKLPPCPACSWQKLKAKLKLSSHTTIKRQHASTQGQPC